MESAGFLGLPQSRSAMGLKTRGSMLSEARISMASQIPRPFGRVRIAYSDPVTLNAASAREAAEDTARFQALMAQVEHAASA